MCFSSLFVGAGNWYLHFYHGNAPFNIKLILRIIRYRHNNMCFLKVSYDSVNYLILSFLFFYLLGFIYTNIYNNRTKMQL